MGTSTETPTRLTALEQQTCLMLVMIVVWFVLSLLGFHHAAHGFLGAAALWFVAILAIGFTCSLLQMLGFKTPRELGIS